MSDPYSFDAVPKQPTGLPPIEWSPPSDPLRSGSYPYSEAADLARKGIIYGLGRAAYPLQQMASGRPEEIIQGLGQGMQDWASPEFGGALAALHLMPYYKYGAHDLTLAHDVVDDLGKKVAEFTMHRRMEDPGLAGIPWAVSRGEKSGSGPLGGSPGALGHRELRSLIPEVRKLYPEFERVVGEHRISGAGRQAEGEGGTGYGYVPVRIRKDMSPEELETAKASAAQWMEDLHTGLLGAEYKGKEPEPEWLKIYRERQRTGLSPEGPPPDVPRVQATPRELSHASMVAEAVRREATDAYNQGRITPQEYNERIAAANASVRRTAQASEQRRAEQGTGPESWLDVLRRRIGQQLEATEPEVQAARARGRATAAGEAGMTQPSEFERLREQRREEASRRTTRPQGTRRLQEREQD